MWSMPVVGVGAISSLGKSWAESWSGLLSGRRYRVSPSDVFPVLTAGHHVTSIHGIDRTLECVNGVACGAALRLALAAGKEALANILGGGEVVVYGGSNHGESDLVSCLTGREEIGDARNEAHLWEGLLIDSVAEGVAREVQNSAHNALGSWVYSSCTSSLHALLLAALAIRGTPSRYALVIGVDALSLAGVAGFTAAGAATQTDCRPFSHRRDGMLMGEGAAALLLRSEEATTSESHVCLLGAGLYCEKHHPTRPDPSGSGFERAIRQALSRASVAAEEIAGLVLHGTGTAANDDAEALAVRRVFPNRPPATSLKSSLGHTMGASGLFNCLTAFEASRSGALPPTTPDRETAIEGIDLVQECPRTVRIGAPIVTTGAAFGGNYAAFVFGHTLTER